MSVYIPNMASLQSTMWLEALVYIYLSLSAYAPEQICLSHHRYVYATVPILCSTCRPHFTAHINKKKTATLITML